MKYAHIISEFRSTVWAMLPEKLAIIRSFLEMSAAGGKLSEEEVQAITAGPKRVTPKTPGSVAVIPIYGVISHRANMLAEFSGGTSIEKLTTGFREALADPNVKAIVFDIDSPGGDVAGVAELADEIYASRSQKKTIAVANTLAASAAYWLGASASEFVATPSSIVGSIGVYGTHEDLSKAMDQEGIKVTLISAGKYKVEGNPFEPLSDEAKAAIQERVDAFYSLFVRNVAKGRGVTPAQVKEGYGQGRIVMAGDAVSQGMADRVATLDQVFAKLGVSSAPPPSLRGEAGCPTRAMLERELAIYE